MIEYNWKDLAKVKQSLKKQNDNDAFQPQKQTWKKSRNKGEDGHKSEGYTSTFPPHLLPFLSEKQNQSAELIPRKESGIHLFSQR